MQQDVGELSLKLLRSLDDAYNVIDMPAVLEVISVLEKISISKELLQSSRLGKYVNEVRRNTTDDQLAKRTRDLVKKWRNEFIAAESNGQLQQQQQQTSGASSKRNVLGPQLKGDGQTSKRPRLNGNNELDLSDNSNSSFKDALMANASGRSSADLLRKDNSVIVVNSDSNSSVPDVMVVSVKQDPALEQQLPKKRGRKKGSKNHKSLLDEAETSFSNKMAVSRGNAKVKTTQELIASLQNRNNTLLPGGRVKEDLNEKAAKLTERVSIIDQKLYSTSANNFRRKKRGVEANVVNLKEEPVEVKKEEEVIVVDDVKTEDEKTEKVDIPRALSIEEALNQLPPIDRSFLDSIPPPVCTCNFDEETSTYTEDVACPAAKLLNETYDLSNVSEAKVDRYLSCYVPNLNGNESLGVGLGPPEVNDDGLYKNVVPNRASERMPPKCNSNSNDQKLSGDLISDDIKRYRISESSGELFREWHEVVETRSYDGEVIRILPYVVID